MNGTAAIRLAALTLLTVFCGFAAAADEPASTHRAMPKVTFSSREDYYPPPAKRTGLEGLVSVAFSIDGKGRVVNPSILYSDAAVFSEGVLRLLSTAHADVPADWQDSDKDHERYLLSIRFELTPCGHLSHFELRSDTIDICGSRIPGSTPHQGTEGISRAR